MVEDANGIVNKHELSVQFSYADYETPDELHYDPDAVDICEDDQALFLRRACSLGLQLQSVHPFSRCPHWSACVCQFFRCANIVGCASVRGYHRIIDTPQLSFCRG